jgi:hypothetical protein
VCVCSIIRVLMWSAFVVSWCTARFSEYLQCGAGVLYKSHCGSGVLYNCPSCIRSCTRILRVYRPIQDSLLFRRPVQVSFVSTVLYKSSCGAGALYKSSVLSTPHLQQQLTATCARSTNSCGIQRHLASVPHIRVGPLSRSVISRERILNAVVFNLFVRVPSDVISLQLCTPPPPRKLLVYNSRYTQSIIYI